MIRVSNLLFCAVILKLAVFCMNLSEVRIQYPPLFENGLARDKIISNVLARRLSSFEL